MLRIAPARIALSVSQEIVADMLAQHAASESRAASIKDAGAAVRARIRTRTADEVAALQLPALPPSAFHTRTHSHSHSTALRGFQSSSSTAAAALPTSSSSSSSSPSSLPLLHTTSEDAHTGTSDSGRGGGGSGATLHDQHGCEASADREVAAHFAASSLMSADSDAAAAAASAHTPKPRKFPHKPAWSLTAEQAQRIEEEEVDELLDFASDLDYDRCAEYFAFGVLFFVSVSVVVVVVVLG
jgi:hypothetical protein